MKKKKNNICQNSSFQNKNTNILPNYYENVYLG